MHLSIHRTTAIPEHNKIFFSFVYSSNNSQDRRTLWGELRDIGCTIIKPWWLMVDFNAVSIPKRLTWQIRNLRWIHQYRVLIVAELI